MIPKVLVDPRGPLDSTDPGADPWGLRADPGAPTDLKCPSGDPGVPGDPRSDGVAVLILGVSVIPKAPVILLGTGCPGCFDSPEGKLVALLTIGSWY